MAKLGLRKGNVTNTHMVLCSIRVHCWFWAWLLTTLLQVCIWSHVGGKIKQCCGESGWQCLCRLEKERTLQGWSEIKQPSYSFRAGVPNILLCCILSISFDEIESLDEFCLFQLSCFSTAFNTSTVIFHFTDKQQERANWTVYSLSSGWHSVQHLTDITGQSINNCATVFSKKIIIGNYSLYSTRHIF